MRFSTTALLALPLLAAAAESPFEQYKAQFQNFLSSFGVKTPGSAEKEAAPATEAKPKASKGSSKAKEITTLTLENWNSTFYEPVKPGATTPEEWWLLVSGRNKTCFGHCLKVEAAFNESAVKFASLPKAPHLAYLNCEDQPVLCNGWSASTGSLWVFEILPQPAPINIYLKRLNLTSTTAQTFLDYHTEGVHETFKLHDGYFHPYDGPIAKSGLSVPVGYFFWIFNLIPSWAFMIGISMLSRRVM
ncbi:hypothetical protein GQ53DRAFT_325298 [Thozetella sp. PMI_491]|nr:hypothetical protein GQ53DRAFT_325298 [Thozetella sp. PMI_491]